MRSLHELINVDDPGWSFVSAWIDSSTHKVEVLPRDSASAELALIQLQVTTRSPMGAVVYETGGILIDGGWIRILGSGHKKLNRTLPGWNKKSGAVGFILIADDAIGGFFALNGGALGEDLGKVYYFAPDNLEYEPLNWTYTDFLIFCFSGDHDTFYDGLRWFNWQSDASVLSGDDVFNFYPTLWSKENKGIEHLSRKAVPIAEQYFLNLDFRKQLIQNPNSR
ncbi:MAG: DUF2625 domain-containing protein [Pedobacter sp.]|nr:MAG: DUF2625 domain-containing protein [Pedobacter sp.]